MMSLFVCQRFILKFPLCDLMLGGLFLLALKNFSILWLQDGYRDMLKLADNFSAFNQRLKYAHFRPHVSVKSNPQSWWKYAYRAVSDQLKKGRYLTYFSLFFFI